MLEMESLDIMYHLFRIFLLICTGSLGMIIIINVINDTFNPFIEGNKPPSKYFNVIQYKPVPCLYCGKYVDRCYKRCIFGIAGWNGGISCGTC